MLAGVPAARSARIRARHPILRRWDHKPASPARTCCPSSKAPGSSSRTACRCASSPAASTGRATTGRSRRARSPPTSSGRATTTAIRSRARRPASPTPTAGSASSRSDADGSVTVVSDCRDLFPPLTALEQLLYVSGDGQDAAPNALLPQPLARARRARQRAGRRSRRPLRGRERRRRGRQASAAGRGCSRRTTDADGLATCHWRSAPAPRRRGRFQRVRASLLDADGQPLPGQFVVFCATASLALQYVSRRRPAGGRRRDAAAPARIARRQRRRRHRRRGAARRPSSRAAGAIVGPSTLTDRCRTAMRRSAGGSAPAARSASRCALPMRRPGPAALALRRDDRSTATAPAAAATSRSARAASSSGSTASCCARLLEQGRGAICLCFLPGTHDVESLERRRPADAAEPARLRPDRGAARARRVQLSGLTAVELRDLLIGLTAETGITLRTNSEVRLAGLTVARGAQESNEPLLSVRARAACA